ncbi:hypothetical protein [Motilibacter aurantiacus]|uniref:hypothetical protein n=1 Tax=Motilibacter aurantiacus TaxID=2714955 RepID=UPI00140DEB73|nr:hypothetical protein [Motilibacter aurantiacus]NHC47643.1 hypothetical protein [Motilibacter aurantiacus]
MAGGDVRREALARYNAQPRVLALRAAFGEAVDVARPDGRLSPDEVPREAYVEIATLGAFCGTSLLRDGSWLQRPFALGVGWEAELAWLRVEGRWAEEASPDTMVSAVDVHF